MKILLTFLFTGLFCCSSFDLNGQQDTTYRQFYDGFKSPPPRAYPHVYYWWLGGHVDTVRMKEEIQGFRRAGIAGFTIFEIGSRDTTMVGTGPAFLSNGSLETIRLAVEEAGKLGLVVSLNTASSWNAGGTWIPPKYASKSIYRSTVTITGGKPLDIQIPFPEIPELDPRGRKRMIEYRPDGLPVYYEEIAVLAVPEGKAGIDTGNILDLSRYFDPITEKLNWDAPAGNWDIVRYVCSNSGEQLVLPSKYSAGPILDHFQAEATAFHFNYIIDRLESVLGDLRKTALKSLYMASYEAKSFAWTPDLPATFSKTNGYSLIRFLPVLFDEGNFHPSLEAAFKADFQRTLSELMIHNFYRKSKKICHSHGLENNSEAGGPGKPVHNVPVEPLKALGTGLDIPRGEFWINHGVYNDDGMDVLRVVKEVSAASHIYGSGIVEMEAFTSFQHWQEGPFEMKPIGDRAFAEGMNKVVVHGSTHNPEGTGFPGIVYHAGTHYNDKRLWWPGVRPFNDYLARVSYILQEADFVADVAFYYGDTIPNYGGHKHGRFSAGPGYDYEIINTDILLDMEVKNGKLIIPQTGAAFEVLVLTKEFEINPKVLIKLKSLLDVGAHITGPKPSGIVHRKIQPTMPDMKAWVDDMWRPFNPVNFRDFPKSVFYDADPSRVLISLGTVPDLSYEGMEYFTLDYIHYQKEGLDFYFVVNTLDQWVSRSISFRQRDKIPEVWDPVNGRIVEAPVYKKENHYTTLPLSLAPHQSIFIVFKPGHNAEHYLGIDGPGIYPPLIQYTESGLELWENGDFELDTGEDLIKVENRINHKVLDGAWEVFFPEGWGAPERAIFPALESWTESEDQGIKYFSGIARYEKRFVMEKLPGHLPHSRIYLDLGDLSNVGEVWLNDHHLGITWARPYRFDITDYLRRGVNILKVDISNTWSNRIVGDALTGKKYTHTNIRETKIKGIGYKSFPWVDVPLIPSGLFGLVKLVAVPSFYPPQHLSVATIFSNNMVLQRNQPIPVWGKAMPREKITVKLGKTTESAIAGRDGHWMVYLPALPAGGPYEMNIQGTDDEVVFNNILMGDVWLASGQSNMHHPISGWDWIPHSEIAHATETLKDTDYPEVRLFKVPLSPSPQPMDDLTGGQWKRVGTISLAEFSATGWFFAKKLNHELDVPIGIIQSSWGGTSIRTWLDPELLQRFKDSLSLEKYQIDNYDPRLWNINVQESIVQNIARRNQISYPDPQIKARFLHSESDDAFWLGNGLAEVGDSSRVVWLRQTVNIPKVPSGDSVELSLGFLNRQSNVYWNGEELGYFQYPAPVIVKIPSQWIKSGNNNLLVRMANPWEKPAILGKESLFYLKEENGDLFIPLYKQWSVAEKLQEIVPEKSSFINYPGYLYNGMIAPVIPYGIKGFIWDQGGADASRPDLYVRLFQALIRDWRHKWSDERLPFLFVQSTATYSSHDRERRSFVRSYLREAQEKALQLPATGMIVSLDIGDPYDVHPKNKQEFGRRLALQALKKVYRKDVVADGPFYESHYFKGDTIVIQLRTEADLVTRGLKNEYNGFELVGEDGTVYPAKAWVLGHSVYVTSPKMKVSNELRYAWGNYPVNSIFNDQSLPLAPFRIKIP